MSMAPEEVVAAFGKLVQGLPVSFVRAKLEMSLAVFRREVFSGQSDDLTALESVVLAMGEPPEIRAPVQHDGLPHLFDVLWRGYESALPEVLQSTDHDVVTALQRLKSCCALMLVHGDFPEPADVQMRLWVLGQDVNVPYLAGRLQKVASACGESQVSVRDERYGQVGAKVAPTCDVLRNSPDAEAMADLLAPLIEAQALLFAVYGEKAEERDTAGDMLKLLKMSGVLLLAASLQGESEAAVLKPVDDDQCLVDGADGDALGDDDDFDLGPLEGDGDGLISFAEPGDPGEGSKLDLLADDGGDEDGGSTFPGLPE